MELDLTPAQLRVLKAAGDGHIRRSALDPNRHVHENTWRRPCHCGMRNHLIVTAAVEELKEAGLIAEDETGHWRPTAALRTS